MLIRQGDKWRFCVDFRKTNNLTIPDKYPLQRMDSVFDSLAGMQFFTLIDALKGYHQMSVRRSDRWKTVFACADGLFQYRRVPFGVRNTPAMFQRMMNEMLGSLRWVCALVYIDNVIVYSKNLEDHCQHVKQVLQAAIRIGLKFSPAKCHFAYQKLNLLGRIVSRRGLEINAHRAQPIQVLGPPKTFEDLYHVLGLFGSYRSFIYGPVRPEGR